MISLQDASFDELETFANDIKSFVLKKYDDIGLIDKHSSVWIAKSPLCPKDRNRSGKIYLNLIFGNKLQHQNFVGSDQKNKLEQLIKDRISSNIDSSIKSLVFAFKYISEEEVYSKYGSFRNWRNQ